MMKPRPFNHKPIFIDERKERLAQVEQRARGEASAVKPSALEGVFTSRQQRKSAIQLSVPMLEVRVSITQPLARSDFDIPQSHALSLGPFFCLSPVAPGQV